MSHCIYNVPGRLRCFDTSKALTNDQTIRKAASRAGSLVEKAIFGTFVDKALEGSALSLITLLI